MYAKKVPVASLMWSIIGSRSRRHHQSIEAHIVATHTKYDSMKQKQVRVLHMLHVLHAQTYTENSEKDNGYRDGFPDLGQELWPAGWKHAR